MAAKINWHRYVTNYVTVTLCTCLSVSVSVCHKSEFYIETAEAQEELSWVFLGRELSFDLSSTVVRKFGSFQKQGCTTVTTAS